MQIEDPLATEDTGSHTHVYKLVIGGGLRVVRSTFYDHPRPDDPTTIIWPEEFCIHTVDGEPLERLVRMKLKSLGTVEALQALEALSGIAYDTNVN